MFSKFCVFTACSLFLMAPFNLVAQEKPEKKEKEQKSQKEKEQEPKKRRQNPAGDYKPEPPFDLTGALPYDDKIINSIENGIYYLLQQQREDGSWDVELKGQFLSRTADEAVDAVTATSLAGLALRENAHYDLERVNKALEKSSDFIIDRINRGKLSVTVQYAVWRYVFSLRFLTAEYRMTTNEDYKKRILQTVPVIVEQLKRMQLAKSVEEKKSSNQAAILPAHLGLKVSTKKVDGLNRAVIEEVLPGFSGHEANLIAGDQIISINKFLVNSHYSYYRKETEFLSGDELSFDVMRDGKLENVTFNVKAIWPASFEADVRPAIKDKKGLELAKVRSGSALEVAGLKKGDRLLKVNNVVVTRKKDLEKLTDSFYAGDECEFVYLRGKEEKVGKVKLLPRRHGSLDLMPAAEDKRGLDGIVVGRMTPKGVAVDAGIKKGDGITHINHIPVQGVDHFGKLMETMWHGQQVKLQITRKDEKLSLEVILSEKQVRPFFGIQLQQQSNVPVIQEVVKGQPAERAGLKKGDRIKSLDGVEVNDVQSFMKKLFSYRPGQIVDCVVIRGKKEVTRKIELVKRKETPEAAEVGGIGGWNYYHMGVSTSFVTASVLIALLEAEEVIGVEVPEDMMLAAVSAIESMRVEDKTHGIETYAYSGNTVKGDANVRGHMGKLLVCELAMVMASEAGLVEKKKVRNKDNIEKALKIWIKYRHELDRVRNYPLTHYRSLYNNAAYYWLFGHHYTSKAANYIAEENPGLANKTKNIALKALMLKQLPNGTWLGHHGFGPLCGTSQALMIFGALEDTHLPQLRAVRPELAKVANHIKKGRYQYAYEDLKKLKGNKKTRRDWDYLEGALFERANRIGDDLRQTWKRFDLKAAEKGAKKYLKGFKGLPMAKKFEKDFNLWKGSKELKAYQKNWAEFIKLKKEVLAADCFLKKSKADKYVKKIKQYEKFAKNTKLSEESATLREELLGSFKGHGLMGITLDQTFKGEGAKIESVSKNTCASLAGLRGGDIIQVFNGQKIENSDTLITLIRKTKPGDGAIITIKSGKEVKKVMIVLGRKMSN